MKQRLNSSVKLYFALAALVVAFGVAQLQAASPAETLAWNAAVNTFKGAKGPTQRALADVRFVDFMKKYPTSEFYDEAVVFRAQLMFVQQAYDGVINLLKSESGRASNSADEFAYWTAQAYYQKKNYEAAADEYARLVRENTNSTRRLEALYLEAESHSKLGYWPRIVEELGETNGAFQLVAQTNRDNELVVNGLLLLGEAQLAQRAYGAAENTLTRVVTDHVPKVLEWERQELLCRVRMGAGRGEEALGGISNLLAVAVAAGKPELTAKSHFLAGEIEEGLRRIPEAIKSYETNLTSGDSLERRQALLNIVELELQEHQFASPAQLIEKYIASHPDEQGADLYRLLLGELQLRQYYQGTNEIPGVDAGTNLLQSAQSNFVALLAKFTNSAYAGKAELNLGWCLLAQSNYPGSLAAFSNAVEHLPFSADQAVAHLKLGDLLYQQGNYDGALEQYSGITIRYDSLPVVKNELLEQVLYSIVTTAIDEKNPKKNVEAAQLAMAQILALFPDGPTASRSMLLVGQEQNPVEARETFDRFATLYPQSPLLPDVKLARARADEREGRWKDAVVQFNNWALAYSNSPALPRAEFSRAWASYKAGDESNAFTLFTNFVERFGTNEIALGDDLPARAKFWVGDYYWRQGDYQQAESCFEKVFRDWPQSDLAFQARMMAGRMAHDGQRPQTAITYFTNLYNLYVLSNSPPALAATAAQALFAVADTTLALPPGADTNKYNNYSEAINYYRSIATDFTNLPIAPQALGQLGVCYYALAGTNAAYYGKASNAFDMAMTNELADATTRSMAEVWLGKTLKAQALVPSASDVDPQPMFVHALDHFLTVMHGENLRAGERADPWWVREAGLESAQLAEDLGEWDQAIDSYEVLKGILPALQSSLDKKIDNARKKMADANK